MSDESPQPKSAARFVPSGAAAVSLREALEAVDAHQEAVGALTAEDQRRDQARAALLQAHAARQTTVNAEAKALMRAIPKRRAADWSREERAQVRDALRAAAAHRLNQTLGELPPVPAPAAPQRLPKLRLTPAQRQALQAAQRRAEKVGETLLPKGFRLVRPYNKKATPVKVTKRAVVKARRAAAKPEAAVLVTVSPPGPWSISEDGLE